MENMKLSVLYIEGECMFPTHPNNVKYRLSWLFCAQQTSVLLVTTRLFCGLGSGWRQWNPWMLDTSWLKLSEYVQQWNLDLKAWSLTLVFYPTSYKVLICRAWFMSSIQLEHLPPCKSCVFSCGSEASVVWTPNQIKWPILTSNCKKLA